MSGKQNDDGIKYNNFKSRIEIQKKLNENESNTKNTNTMDLYVTKIWQQFLENTMENTKKGIVPKRSGEKMIWSDL